MHYELVQVRTEGEKVGAPGETQGAGEPSWDVRGDFRVLE